MGTQRHNRHARDIVDVFVKLHDKGRLDLLSGKHLGRFGLIGLEEFVNRHDWKYSTDRFSNRNAGTGLHVKYSDV